MDKPSWGHSIILLVSHSVVVQSFRHSNNNEMLTKQRETNKQVENKARTAVAAANKQVKRVEAEAKEEVSAAARDRDKQGKRVEAKTKEEVKQVEAKATAKVGAAVRGYGEDVQQLHNDLRAEKQYNDNDRKQSKIEYESRMSRKKERVSVARQDSAKAVAERNTAVCELSDAVKQKRLLSMHLENAKKMEDQSKQRCEKMSNLRDRHDKDLNGMHNMMFEMLDEMSVGTKVAQSAQNSERTATELATSRLDKMKDI